MSSSGEGGALTDAAALSEGGRPTGAGIPSDGGGIVDAATSVDAEGGTQSDGVICGETTCDPTWQFCMDSVSAAGETFQCAELPAVCPCPATCATLLGAYSSSNALARQPNAACLFDSGASGVDASSGSVLAVPLTCTTDANGGLMLRGDTFPCGGGHETTFCLSASEYCFGLGFYAGGTTSFGCQPAPSQCAPPSCACLDSAGAIGNPSSGGSGSSSGYGPPRWTCTDDGGVQAVEMSH